MVANLNPHLCTHIIYAFANLNGNAIGVNDQWADIGAGGYSQFVGLKSQNSKLKAMIAIGGATSAGFSSLVSSTSNINTFVSSVVAFLNQYNFDGLDIDWEYPIGAADKVGFSNLLTALRQAFGTKYLLSAAVGAVPTLEGVDGNN